MSVWTSDCQAAAGLCRVVQLAPTHKYNTVAVVCKTWFSYSDRQMWSLSSQPVHVRTIHFVCRDWQLDISISCWAGHFNTDCVLLLCSRLASCGNIHTNNSLLFNISLLLKKIQKLATCCALADPEQLCQWATATTAAASNYWSCQSSRSST